MKKKLLFYPLVFLTLQGCSHYMNRFYKQLDRDLDKKPEETDTFSAYRKKNDSAGNINVFPKKRYKAEDLGDFQDDGSLWNERSKNRFFLLADNIPASYGDIVVIEVEKRLKREITAELKRAYMSEEKNKEGQNARKDLAEDQESEGDKRVYDRISTVIVEDMGKEHILLRGRKKSFYKSHKRSIEIQALVPRRAISSKGIINSSEIIEFDIKVFP